MNGNVENDIFTIFYRCISSADERALIIQLGIILKRRYKYIDIQVTYTDFQEVENKNNKDITNYQEK